MSKNKVIKKSKAKRILKTHPLSDPKVAKKVEEVMRDLKNKKNKK